MAPSLQYNLASSTIDPPVQAQMDYSTVPEGTDGDEGENSRKLKQF